MENKKLLTISKAAKTLGVSLQTLRRWDTTGIFSSIRATKGGNRYYDRQKTERFMRRSLKLFCEAELWASSQDAHEPNSDKYCQNSGVFQARLQTMELLLMKNKELENIYSSLTSIAGEIGNNSFDHNLVSWPDMPGVFFAYDIEKKYIVLADRGQGILATLKRVLPELSDHLSALRVAFTETITGRAPEHRGNGLKYVLFIIKKYPFALFFRTGDAELSARHEDNEFLITGTETSMRGCLALIIF